MADPSPLRLPPDFIEVANTLATIDDSRFAAVVGILESHGGEVSRHGFSRQMAEQLEWPSVLADRLLWMVTSLTSLGRDLEYPDLEALARSFSESPDINDPAERPRLAERIGVLLRSEAIELLSRGQDLISEHEHLVSSIRILSDIRPLFDTADGS